MRSSLPGTLGGFFKVSVRKESHRFVPQVDVEYEFSLHILYENFQVEKSI